MRAPVAVPALSAELRELFEATPGAGAPPAGEAGWRHGRAGSLAAEACVEVWLRLTPAGAVQALRYRVWGCPHTIVALAWLAQHWPGGRPDSPPGGGPQGWQAALGIPVDKLGRLLIIEDALRAAGAGAPDP
jgi:hypothetical protein